MGDTDNDTNNESPMITIITTSSTDPEILSSPPPQSLISSSSPPSSVKMKSSGPSITSEEITSHIKQRSDPLLPDNENNYSQRVTVKPAENMSEAHSAEGLTSEVACGNARETPRQITSLHDI